MKQTNTKTTKAGAKSPNTRTTKNKFAKLPVSRRPYVKPLLMIVLFAVIGAAFLLATRAATVRGRVIGMNGLCLDNVGGRLVDGNSVRIAGCRTTGNLASTQFWTFRGDGTIRSSNTHCLDVRQAGGPGGSPLVILRNCTNGNVGQQWRFGGRQIKHNQSRLCLDLRAPARNGSATVLVQCNTRSRSQQWILPKGVTNPPGTSPNPTPTPPTPPPSTGIPTKQSIISGAGPNTSSFTNRGSFTITSAGSTQSNFSASKVTVRASNVTLRNCRVVGGGYVVELAAGFTNLTVEDCHIQSTGSSAALYGAGSGLRARRNMIIGRNGDAIKAQTNSVYEYNVIKTSKTGDEHADGIQGEGRSNYQARYNYFDLPANVGGNISLFVQSWGGGRCSRVTNVDFSYNYIRGGNHGIYAEGYKRGRCTPATNIIGLRVVGNRFVYGPKDGTVWRHTYCTFSNTNFSAKSNNLFETGGVPAGC